jgi:hypothetical protein
MTETDRFLTSAGELLPQLRPLLRSFCVGDLGIALGGAHAKGAADPESDLDLYVFSRQILPMAERDRLCRQFSERIHTITSWGDDAQFVQGGTDFYIDRLKVEVWFREIDYISGIVAECQQGIVRHDWVVWTVMGFFNHCALSDLHNMIPLDDPAGILAGWQESIAQYPPALRQRILRDYLAAAQFWPENFHYISAVRRCDLIYTAGIVQQVIQNLIQVLFAYNAVYFPGEKKLALALEHLPRLPKDFTARIQRLLFPESAPDAALLEWQRMELVALVKEVKELIC